MAYAIAINHLTKWWIDPRTAHEDVEQAKINYLALILGPAVMSFAGNRLPRQAIGHAWKTFVEDNYCAGETLVVKVVFREDYNTPVAWAVKTQDGKIHASSVGLTLASCVLNGLHFIHGIRFDSVIPKDTLMAMWQPRHGRIVPISMETPDVDYVFNRGKMADVQI